jgi:protein-arginine deiminase
MPRFARCFALVSFLGGAFASQAALAVQLAADVDRNGIVEFALDDTGEDSWTTGRGAVFLNNCDSDQDSGVPDNSDNVTNGANDLADLATVLVARMPSLPAGSSVTLAADTASRPNTRLFLRGTGGVYTVLDPTASPNIPDSLLRDGDVEVRIEGRSFATASWNGEALLTVTVVPPGGGQETDSVRLRVGPFLLLSNAMEGSEIYVRAYPGQNDTFISQLQSIIPPTGGSVVVSPGNAPYNYNDIWMQDAMEIGYTEMPGSRLSVVMKSNRGSSWLLSNFPYDELLGPDYGWLNPSTYRSTYAGGVAPNGWLDWFGNLEVTPPIAGYPHGRVYYGKNGAASLDPAIVGLLDAQGYQGPALALDTGWLLIKHVDEMICWIPTGNSSQPYKVMVPDTGAMIALLDAWASQGYGSVSTLNVYHSGMTVATLRSDSTMRTYNQTLQSTRIEPMITAIKTAWGLSESDLVRVPSYYSSDGGAYYPSMVNSVVMNGRLLIADPRGPVVGGKDLLQEDLKTRLAGVALTPRFLADQRYHKWSGNVHCATNVRRAFFEPPVYTSVPARMENWVLY